jgi:hypothetical protein
MNPERVDVPQRRPPDDPRSGEDQEGDLEVGDGGELSDPHRVAVLQRDGD